MKVYGKKRVFKRTKRNTKRRNLSRTKTFGKTGFFKIMRWSNNDTTNNCHLQLTGNDTLPTGDFTTVFAMSQIAGQSELYNLFDNYRIVKVQYRWVLLRDPNSATMKNYPRIVWTHDFNDSTAIARSLIMQRANMKEAYFNDNYQKTKWYTLNPAMLVIGYESPTQSAYTPKWRQWLDTNDSATPHYGIKASYSELYTGINIRLEAKVFMEFKGIS